MPGAPMCGKDGAPCQAEKADAPAEADPEADDFWVAPLPDAAPLPLEGPPEAASG